MVNFRVIDGEDYYDKYDNFVEEYRKGTLQKDIFKKLGLSDMRYRNYLKKATQEGLLEPRSKSRVKNAKYYTRTPSGNYIITRRDKKSGKQLTYGTYKSVKEVESRVKELIENDWIVMKK